MPSSTTVRGTTYMPEDYQRDALQRINAWLERLEDRTRLLLDTFLPEELEPVQAANVAVKYVTLIARLLDLRQHFLNQADSEEEKLLRIIFGEQSEALSLLAGREEGVQHAND